MEQICAAQAMEWNVELERGLRSNKPAQKNNCDCPILPTVKNIGLPRRQRSVQANDSMALVIATCKKGSCVVGINQPFSLRGYAVEKKTPRLIRHITTRTPLHQMDLLVGEHAWPFIHLFQADEGKVDAKLICPRNLPKLGDLERLCDRKPRLSCNYPTLHHKVQRVFIEKLMSRWPMTTCMESD
eukprot:Gb_21225 [translate_table: standard]